MGGLGTFHGGKSMIGVGMLKNYLGDLSILGECGGVIGGPVDCWQVLTSMSGPLGVLGAHWWVKVLALPTSAYSLSWANALALLTGGAADPG